MLESFADWSGAQTSISWPRIAIGLSQVQTSNGALPRAARSFGRIVTSSSMTSVTSMPCAFWNSGTISSRIVFSIAPPRVCTVSERRA